MPNVLQDAFNAHKSKTSTQSAKDQIKLDTFLATLSNGKTHADEAAIFVRILLAVLTGFVVYLGFNYYLDTFLEMFPPWAAYAFAIALPICVEIAKIRLSILGLRSLVFGWFVSSWSALPYWGCVILLSMGGFVWSYKISTGGIKEVSRDKAETKNELPPLEKILALATSDIDAQISDIKASNGQAANMKTKKGRTNWAGQSIQMNNAAALPSLQSQRAQISAEKTEWYKRQEGKTETKVNRWAGFIERFGGWGEWGTLLCVFALVFFEAHLRTINKKDLDTAQKTVSQNIQNPSTVSQPIQHIPNGRPSVFNQSLPDEPRNQIGFRYGENLNKTVSQPIQSLSVVSPVETISDPIQSILSSKTVSQPIQQDLDPFTAGCDGCLLGLRTKLQADIGNLNRGSGKVETVTNRIYKAFDECLEAMNREDFRPSRFTGAKVYGYLVETAIPALNGRGYPYEKDTFFLKRLLSVIPKG